MVYAGRRAMCPQRSSSAPSRRSRSRWWIRPGRGPSPLPLWSLMRATATTQPSCGASTTGRSPTWWGSAAPLGCGGRRRCVRSPPCRLRVRGGEGSLKSHVLPRCIRPTRCWRPSQPTAGRPSPGVRMRGPSSANNVSPCGCTVGHGWSTVLHDASSCLHGLGGLASRRAPAPRRARRGQMVFQEPASGHAAATAGGTGAQPLAYRAILRGRQGRVWPGRLPGPALGWAASAPRLGYAGV